MKFPLLLLPRSVYDDLQTDLKAKDARIKELTDLVVDAKMSGAQIVRRASAGLKLPTREITAIEKAIDEHPKCRANRALRARMLDWADLQREKGVSEEDILDRVTSWDTIAEDDEDDAIVT